ncbi:Mobile element protein [Streptococcus sp. DD11]|nr:Mobile element protein [Streptococcus sp. DD11]
MEVQPMFHKNQVDLERQQLELMSLDMLVPQDHFLRKVEKVVDFDFIYDLLEDSYSPDQGRPSLDPVLLIKIPLLKTLYGIRSMPDHERD